jgi:hypothetical protein
MKTLLSLAFACAVLSIGCSESADYTFVHDETDAGPESDATPPVQADDKKDAGTD